MRNQAKITQIIQSLNDSKTKPQIKSYASIKYKFIKNKIIRFAKVPHHHHHHPNDSKTKPQIKSYTSIKYIFIKNKIIRFAKAPHHRISDGQ